MRGSRIRNIVDELGGEKIDIVRWNESSQVLIANALKPAEVEDVSLCFELGRATIIVRDDQLSLAIGRHGQNVRLAARLTGWDIDILTPAEFSRGLEILEQTIRPLDGVTDEMLDRMGALGMISVFDVEEVGLDVIQEELGMTAELGQQVIDACVAQSKIVAEQLQKEKEEAEARRKEEEAAARAVLGGGGAVGAAPAPATDAEAESAAASILGDGPSPTPTPTPTPTPEAPAPTDGGATDSSQNPVAQGAATDDTTSA